MKSFLLYFSIFAIITTMGQTIHQFKVESIDGGVIDFSQYKGKKIMIVNVASKCGFTPQYKQLQELHENFSDKIAIVGFPCNDFGGQEPGSNEEIQTFCTTKFGADFPLTTKVNIKRNDVHPVYQWLTKKDQNGTMDAEVRWNFHKFLIDEEGNLYKSLPSTVSPLDEQILDWIQS